MRPSMKMFATLLLLVMCLLANEMGGPMVVEGRTCLSQSHKFKGPCVSDTNCASVCKTEGFPGGDCQGLRRRCFCTKHC
ncbi:Defensin SD2 [Artemisia annua]|uniref:Defensin SD2 n=1 Tax=Artemisia annua TaxID=35608 RepID=A0A2U1QDR0_ARTAN|nr:Defensin SD2 [Artemisia annua]